MTVNRPVIGIWLTVSLLAAATIAFADVAAEIRALTESPTRLVWVGKRGVAGIRTR